MIGSRLAAALARLFALMMHVNGFALKNVWRQVAVAIRERFAPDVKARLEEIR